MSTNADTPEANAADVARSSDRVPSLAAGLKRPRRPSRHGVATIALLAGTVAAVSLAALVLDVGLITYNHRQIQTGCEAAALAGAGELFDGSQPYAQRSAARSRRVQASDRQTWAREQAVHFASQNIIAGRPLALDANYANAPDGDLVIGWMDSPAAPAGRLVHFGHQGPLNSVEVRAQRTRRRVNPVTLWCGRWLGLDGIDMTVRARATVDQRVYGFRPVGHVPVPLVPLMICEPQTKAWLASAKPRFDFRPQDDFVADPRTGEVKRGGDGVPEIVLSVWSVDRSPSESKPHPADSVAHWVPVSGAGLRLDELIGQIEHGLDTGDLFHLGGELTLDYRGHRHLPAPADCRSAELRQLCRALHNIIGERRVWPLGRTATDAHQRPSSQVTGFTAGQLVDCYMQDDAQLVVVLQPCPLQTCTALVRAGVPLNPSIGKLMLTL